MGKAEKTIQDRVMIAIGLIAVIFFVIYLFNIYSNGNDTYQQIEPDIQVPNSFHGLYDTFESGGLDFTLYEVEIYERPRLEGDPYEEVLTFKFNVENNGNHIEQVYDCGKLVFNDGTQYDAQITTRGSYEKQNCYYHEMLPGSKITLWYAFLFSTESDKVRYASVPGTSINFFSDQLDDLVKFTIYKDNVKRY